MPCPAAPTKSARHAFLLVHLPIPVDGGLGASYPCGFEGLEDFVIRNNDGQTLTVGKRSQARGLYRDPFVGNGFPGTQEVASRAILAYYDLWSADHSVGAVSKGTHGQPYLFVANTVRGLTA